MLNNVSTIAQVIVASLGSALGLNILRCTFLSPYFNISEFGTSLLTDGIIITEESAFFFFLSRI